MATQEEDMTVHQFQQIGNLFTDQRLSKKESQQLIESSAIPTLLKADLSFPDVRERIMLAFGLRPYTLCEFISMEVDKFRSFSDHIDFANHLAQTAFGRHIFLSNLPSSLAYNPPSSEELIKAEYVLASINKNGFGLDWEWMLRFWDEDNLVPADHHDIIALALNYFYKQVSSEEENIAYQDIRGVKIGFSCIYAPGSVVSYSKSKWKPYPDLVSIFADRHACDGKGAIIISAINAPLEKGSTSNYQKYFLLMKKAEVVEQND